MRGCRVTKRTTPDAPKLALTAHKVPPIAQCGFTLIELLLVIAMLAIALQITAPPFKERIDDLRSATAMRHLSSFFSMARHEALLRQTPITVCALTSQNQCNRAWTARKSIVAFIDKNQNRRLDDGEVPLREVSWPLHKGEISWRASLARNHIEFETNGGTWQNGTLFYCPESRDARHARALVISHSGRTYMPGDSNGDGIREDRTGRNIRC